MGRIGMSLLLPLAFRAADHPFDSPLLRMLHTDVFSLLVVVHCLGNRHDTDFISSGDRLFDAS